MAITKIIPIKSRLDNCIRYAVNPQKTELGKALEYVGDGKKTANAKYVTGFNCSVDRAYRQMRETQRKFHSEKGVLGYHVILSFKPGEVTPDRAFEYGSEFVRRNLAQKYEVVMATHIDRAHIHCHIVFNSVSFVDGKKFRNNFKDYFKDIRGLADSICREHELSVIENPKNNGLHYAEWQAEVKGKPTVRGQMRAELDGIISQSRTYPEFWQRLKRAGYTVHRRGENIAHTSIVPPYGKRPIRLDSLGEGYSEEDIFQRIASRRYGIRAAAPSELPKRIPMRQFKRRRLKGFTALYFHYLYLFGRIQKHKAPQKASFFMRSELTKLERYQRQFKFLYRNGIEKMSQLTEYRERQEAEIAGLAERRKASTDEEEIAGINERLRSLRSDVRLCGKIAADAVHIKEKFEQAEDIIKSEERQVNDREKRKKQQREL